MAEQLNVAACTWQGQAGLVSQQSGTARGLPAGGDQSRQDPGQALKLEACLQVGDEAANLSVHDHDPRSAAEAWR